MSDQDGTRVQLREYMEKCVRAQEQRFEIKLEAMQDALNVANKEIDRRLIELNALRQEVTTDRGQFVKKDVYDLWRDTVEKRLTTSETRAITWTAAIGLFFVVVSIVMKFIK